MTSGTISVNGNVHSFESATSSCAGVSFLSATTFSGHLAELRLGNSLVSLQSEVASLGFTELPAESCQTFSTGCSQCLDGFQLADGLCGN